MKRREFIVTSTTVVVGGALCPLEILQAAPCPPSTVAIVGGVSASSTCGTSIVLPQGGLISRVAIVTVTSGNAANISDANYNLQSRSSGTPVTITYDISAIPNANRQKLLWQWRSDNGYSVDHALIGQPGYNNLGAYTIQGNMAPGGTAPLSGWVTLVTINGNTRTSRQHALSNVSSYNWLRKVCTASDGSSGNYDVAISINIHDISTQNPIDGWLIVGDSITANSMDWHNNGSVASDSFGNRVGAVLGFIPPMDHAGWPGITATSLATNQFAQYQSWLSDFPGKYVGIVLGSNRDASAAAYKSALQTLISAAQSAGKTVVLGKPPYATLAGFDYLASYVSIIEQLWSEQPAVKHGPDMYSYFLANSGQISGGDGLHPNDTGNMNFRRLWAEAAVAVYQSGG
jgi:lysophospholipase L1-like esterase